MTLLIILGFEFPGCIMDTKIIFISPMLIKTIEGTTETVRADPSLSHML